MPDSPSLLRSLLPLVVCTYLLVGWLTPPDPYTQGLWLAGGLVVAVAAAVWFARAGHRTLGATTRDLWLFVAGVLGVVVLGTLLLPNPALSPAQRGALLGVSLVVAGLVVFADGAESVRRRLSGGSE